MQGTVRTQPLVRNEPVEVEKYPVEVQDFRENIEDLWNLWNMTRAKSVKKNEKIKTCNQLDLEKIRILTNYAQKSPWSLV